MFKDIDGVKLDFSDVLIQPSRSTISSRKDVSLIRDLTKYGFHKDGVPLVASNMDTVGTMETAKTMISLESFTCLHKFYHEDDIIKFYNETNGAKDFVFYTLGIGAEDLAKFEYVKERCGVKLVCIDVANGYTQNFLNKVKRFVENNPDIIVMAGNVVTKEVTEQLILDGVKIVKVGIGPGSACTTRMKTGVGYPQLSAIMECADAAHALGGLICADGGCTNSGDVAKALCAGADFVMMGGMLAGHMESIGNDSSNIDDNNMVSFYGMSSSKAMRTHYQGVSNYKASEGRVLKIPFKGFLLDTMHDIMGGIRSTCAYIGAEKIKYMKKRGNFVRVNNQLNQVYKQYQIGE